MKFKTAYEVHKPQFDEVSDEKVTIPGMTMTIREIVRKSIMGLPIDSHVYHDTGIGEFEETFDIVDEYNSRPIKKANEEEAEGARSKPDNETEEGRK